jgi:hypothetical protein
MMADENDELGDSEKRVNNYRDYINYQRNLISPITYSKYFVAYLDILGFSEMVRSGKKADKEKIEIYFSLIREGTKKIRKRNSGSLISSIIISDCVILSIQCDENSDKLDNFINLCLAIKEIQYDLAISDIWLRGAIAYGDAYIDKENNNIVGKSYINSYLLGEHLAKFPRVIVDSEIISILGMTTAQELIETINKQFEVTDEDGEEDGESILFDWEKTNLINAQLPHDIALFVDYLSPNPYRKFLLRKIKDNISKNIYLNMDVYPKYRWVLEYLRICCAQRSVKIEGLSSL